MISSSASAAVEVPAIFGGRPAFPEPLPFVRPTVPDPESVIPAVREILSSRMLTNGRLVRQLESQASEYLGVEHCIAVSSCTAGLMLILRASDLSGDVITPSFTFVATTHAIAWNGLRPVFADVDPATLTLSAAAARRGIGVRTSAILATHTFGTPCDIEGLSEVAEDNGLLLFFDAAHAFGSRHGGRAVGRFGQAEVFSLSPTKVMVAGEGGLITTDDDALAERCRIGRDYANPGDYDARFVGLNARMSEFHAAVALASLDGLDERIAGRNTLVTLYKEALGQIPGITFPSVPETDSSTYKDFTILCDPMGFGMDAQALGTALAAEGIETKRYYAPPVHAQLAYRGVAGTNVGLPVTDWAASSVLTLPLWSSMTESQLARVCEVVRRIHEFVASQTELAGRRGTS
jgi:dTDP-4-amino-4,6-dideoxygalactose transaminase